MVDPRGDAEQDWRMQPDWVQRLASSVGSALVVEDDAPMVDLLSEVDALIDSDAEFVAAMVAQAALSRAVEGRIVSRDHDVSMLTDPNEMDRLLGEALRTRPHSVLLASALAAVGRVAAEQELYQRAKDAYLGAATAWAEVGNAPEHALALLRAGASAYHLEDADAAVVISESARDAYASLGDQIGQVMSVLNIVQAEILRGDVDAAERFLERARDLNTQIRDGHLTASVALEGAILAAERGESTVAREGFRAVYRSARRRGDVYQALVASKNLAVLAADEDASAAAIRWWRIAVSLSQEVGDWREGQGLQRALGVALARVGRYEQASASLQLAVDINLAHDSPADLARTRADLGATVIEQAIKGDLGSDEFERLVARGLDLLIVARQELERVADFEWAATAVRNLRTAWILSNAEAEGAATLIDVAERFDVAEPSYAAEARRNGGWLLLAAGSAAANGADAADLLARTVVATTEPSERAWSLAKQAAEAAERGFDDAALRLYDEALSTLSNDDSTTTLGNILNDSALVLARQGELDEAARRLLQVERIAISADDRVLLSLALSNLGETAATRRHRRGARLLRAVGRACNVHWRRRTCGSCTDVAG